MKAPPDRVARPPAFSSAATGAAAAASCLASQPLCLAAWLLLQHYKALGGRHKCVFEEMTAAKIRLALPLKRVFVVKMRVTAGRRGAPKPLDKQPKVQSAQGGTKKKISSKLSSS